MSTEPLLSDMIGRRFFYKKSLPPQSPVDPVPLDTLRAWMERATAIEVQQAKDRELLQQLVDALKVERDAWHELHDGNCETLRSDEALERAKEAGITPTTT